MLVRSLDRIFDKPFLGNLSTARNIAMARIRMKSCTTTSGAIVDEGWFTSPIPLLLRTGIYFRLISTGGFLEN